MHCSFTGTCGRATPPTWMKTAAAVIALGWTVAAAAEDVAPGALAAAIRASGNPCARVVESERTGQGSSVWRVRCNSGLFEVTKTGDSSFEVVALD